MTYFIVIILVIFSAIFSGLTLGFFSLNKDDLARKAQLGDAMAKKVYQVRKNGNLLLCTLLIGNVSVNSALSIFLGSITSGLVAGILATSLIVLLGEIIPQAVFSRHALKAGSKLVWLVKMFVVIFYPICWPIAWCLDKVLGEEIATVYSKHELLKIIEAHEDSKYSDIDADEERIIKGALSFSAKKVKDIMTPRTQVCVLSTDEKLTVKTIDNIFHSGHSRIPVYEKEIDNVVGILYVKDLILNNNKGKKVSNVARKSAIFVDENKSLDDLFHSFRNTRNHLFIAVNEYGGLSGIVTIEDVIEEIIGNEIVDEYDVYEDMREEAGKKIKKRNIQRI